MRETDDVAKGFENVEFIFHHASKADSSIVMTNPEVNSLTHNAMGYSYVHIGILYFYTHTLLFAMPFK